MKLISWNVNGIRAIEKKDLFKKLEQLDATIVCFQETKAQDDQVQATLSPLEGYFVYSHSAERKGYSGTAIISKIEALTVAYGIGIDEHDAEGRVLTAEFEDFFLVNVYVPNSGSELARLDYRKIWDEDFLAYLKKLEQMKPVIVCGDMNVAHEAIDIARPQANYNKTAGYTQVEIDGMDHFIESGFVDTYRYRNPEKKDAYSWWSYRGGARAKNVGWRIDYFLISNTLVDDLTDAMIFPEIEGSDHCPIGISIDL